MKSISFQLFSLIASTFVFLGLGLTPAQGQIIESELDRLGLRLHWEAQTQQGPNTDIVPTLALWAHTQDRRQSVTVLFNGRSERFDSNGVDVEKYEKSLMAVSTDKSKKTKIASAETTTSNTIPRLGMDGARKQADATEARLEMLARRTHRAEDGTMVVLVGKAGTVEALDAKSRKSLWTKPASEVVFGTGRTRTMIVDEKKYKVIAERIEVDSPNTYLVSSTREGIIQCFNAESGKVVWSTEVGSSILPTFAPGVSDDFVSVVNGQVLYWLNLKDGRILAQRNLQFAIECGTLAVRDQTFMPSMHGHLLGYRYGRPDDLPWSVRSDGNSHSAAVASLDGNFVAWNCEPKFLFVVRVDSKEPRQWSRYESKDPLTLGVAPCSRGFVVAGTGGTVTCIGIPNAKQTDMRGNSMVWRHHTGKGVSRTPVAGHGIVLIITDTEELIALDEERGTSIWNDTVEGILEPISITPTKIYVRTIEHQLAVIDRSNGKMIGKTSFTLPKAYANQVNDRMYFVNERGNLFCLREIGAENPIATYIPVSPAASKKETKRKSESTSEDSGDVFGEEVMSDEGTSEFGEDSDAKPSEDDGDIFGDGN